MINIQHFIKKHTTLYNKQTTLYNKHTTFYKKTYSIV